MLKPFGYRIEIMLYPLSAAHCDTHYYVGCFLEIENWVWSDITLWNFNHIATSDNIIQI